MGTDALLSTGEKWCSLPPLCRLPESPGAEATCHHIFSNSAKLRLGKVKDKSPEVCVFDSHLTWQLSAARGNAAEQASSSSQRLSLQLYSHFAVLLFGPWGRGPMMRCQPSLLGMTQALVLWENGSLAQGRALKKKGQQPLHHTHR